MVVPAGPSRDRHEAATWLLRWPGAFSRVLGGRASRTRSAKHGGEDRARINVDTVPDRDSVQLTIYNSVDLTMVRETRFLTFRKGVNHLEFSWANTLIDPTSVEF